MSVPADFDKEDYSPGSVGTDCDVYLIRLPKTFDVGSLDGKRFSRHHVTEVGREEDTGDLSSVHRSTFYKNDGIGIQPLVKTRQNVIMGCQVKGLVSVTKSIELSPRVGSVASHNSSSLVVMPAGLKTRFTPFGAGEPQKSSLPTQKLIQNLKRKREDSFSESPASSKKKKSKKSRKSLEEFDTPKKKHDIDVVEHCTIKPDPDADLTQEMNHVNDSGINITETVSKSHKKKKKRKSSFLEENGETNFLSDYSKRDLSLNSEHDNSTCHQNGVSKKKKKKKDKRKDDS